jgi:AhpD family alkylhydroperoxidase
MAPRKKEAMKKFYKKKIYSYTQFFRAMVCFFNTLPYLSKAKKMKLINKQFIERIMLAVTEVNGCSLCSYQHTKIALKSGLTTQEIQALLEGETKGLKQDEVIGVLFGKHVADQNGLFDQVYLSRVIKEYGKDKAYGVLGAIRVIMFTNIMGIAIGIIVDTLSGHSKKLSLFAYAFGLLLFMIFALPLAFVVSVGLKLSNNERLIFGYES